MSRHTVPARNPKHTVVVGWDHPMQTFFAHVKDPSLGEEKEMLLWLGGKLREVYEVEDLAKRLSFYATLSPVICTRLYADRDGGL